MTQKFEVGQKLWWVWSRGTPSEVEIVKVGRKWLTLANRNRVLATTLSIEGCRGNIARCYLSKAHYDELLSKNDAWGKFRQRATGYLPPSGASVEAIKQAYQLLFGEEMK